MQHARVPSSNFRQIADVAPVLIWITDAAGSGVWFNKPWLDFTGRSLEQEHGEHWQRLIHPEDRPRYEASYQRAFARHDSFRLDHRLRRADGVWRMMDTTGAPRFAEDGALLGYVGSCVDVTDQRAAEQALRESEEQLRLATEAAEIGLWDLDPNTNTLFWPARVKAMFGISAEAPVCLRDFYAGLHPADRERVSAEFAAALDPQQRRLYDVEYRTIGKEDGVVRWVAAKGRGIFDANGKCTRVIGTAIDISARKRADEHLRELNETLEHRVSEALAERLRDQERLAQAQERLRQAQKLEALGQLTGGVAHDFNNLLQVISGGVMVMQRVRDPDRWERVLQGMRRAAARGASLTRQLLAFSRRQPLKPEPVDLARHLDGMRELLQGTLRGDVRVQTRFAEGLWPVTVDPTELELVVLNLCVNSRDAMPAGGSILISGENVPQLERDRLQGDFVRLSVSDTGTGMAPEVLEHVFEPFFTTKDIGKGSGLGLAQVYGFATQSGGAVEVASKPGEGTTVTLLLPRSRVHAAPAEQIVDIEHPSGGQSEHAGSVLLVEDDDEVAALVGEMLQQLGYRVTRAASPAAGLGALADERSVDVVFCDVMMPGGMSGVALAREIKRRRPGLPILLTSGYVAAAEQDAASEGIEVLPKPFGVEELRAALLRTLWPADAARSLPLAREA